MEEKKRGSLKSTVATKVLVPVVAAGASAAAGYLARKAPRFLEQTVLPKLRDAGQRAGDAAQDLPSRAKSAAGGAGNVAEDLADRARSVVGRDGASSGGGGPSMSTDELERRRSERAEHRAARRKAS
jgi:hypothetical protein